MRDIVYPHAISNQGGTLLEIPILGAMLILAGAMLGPRYPVAFILIILGLGVLFLPYILHFVFTIRNRIWLYRVLSDLRRTGFVVSYLLIGSGAAHAVAFDTIAGNVLWIDLDGSSSEKLADIETVQLLPESWTRLGGPTRTVYTIRFTHKAKHTGFAQPDLWRARWTMRKLKKYLASSTVVTEIRKGT